MPRDPHRAARDTPGDREPEPRRRALPMRAGRDGGGRRAEPEAAQIARPAERECRPGRWAQSAGAAAAAPLAEPGRRGERPGDRSAPVARPESAISAASIGDTRGGSRRSAYGPRAGRRASIPVAGTSGRVRAPGPRAARASGGTPTAAEYTGGAGATGGRPAGTAAATLACSEPSEPQIHALVRARLSPCHNGDR